MDSWQRVVESVISYSKNDRKYLNICNTIFIEAEKSKTTDQLIKKFNEYVLHSPPTTALILANQDLKYPRNE